MRNRKSKAMQHRHSDRRIPRLLSSSVGRTLIIILSFVLVGVIILVSTKAANNSASFQGEDGVMSGTSFASDTQASDSGAVRFGAEAQNPAFRRFYADSASWNRPVSEFGAVSPSSPLAQYRDRFWNYAGLPAPPGDVNVHFKAYSVPIYDVRDATKNVRLFQAIWAQNQQGFSTSGNKIGDSIPWNDSWKPGTGNDRILQIVNYQTGYQYGLWVVGEPKSSCVDRSLLFFLPDGPNTQAGYDENNPDHLCIGAYGQYGGLYDVKDGTTHVDRGMGIDKLALVTRADEVDSGAIRHALELTISSTMFGAPECSPNSGPSAAGAGTDCGFFVPPATRVEFASNENNRIGQRCEGRPITVGNAERSKTIPEGLRVALNLGSGDSQIDAWLATKPTWSAAKKNTAKIFARALRDYGAVIGETGCYGIGIETDGIVNPKTAATWSRLGINDIAGEANPDGDLLDGLFTKERLYIVNPPN